ncbi:hypothetical protein LG943_25550 [Streptomonospora sp. S1-112]|uniref:MORN repeat variant n=1 Tax=Streptomonospora mangrovi TaxID=2883123 RepID=A0A9X3NQQ9_9ACTN|nr:hypothetical protein [Streptomonospora mangrovi]MDA0567662.1 hypothetical protein [Streptomonospora mangrovi]
MTPPDRITDAQIEPQPDGTVLFQGTPYTGEVVELDPEGAVVGLITFRDGREHGPWREWYPDGRPRVEGRVEEGVGAVGAWRTWYPDGRLAQERVFSASGDELSFRRWGPDGALAEERDYTAPP